MNLTKALELGLVSIGLVAGYGFAGPPASAGGAGKGGAPVAHIAAASAPSAAPLADALGGLPGLGPAAPALTPVSGGRHGAESPELRTLRAAEGELFPLAGAPNAPAPGVDPFDLLSDKLCGPDGCQGAAIGKGSGEWLKDLRMPDLPVRPDDEIHRYVRFFSETTRGRKIFSGWLRRSGRYRAVVTEALRDRQLPQDLHALVFVESGYSPTAASSAGAVGLFQFVPSTAKAYGLSVEGAIDERRSAQKSATAGAHHLQDLYERLGSWDLAFAAYNMGYQGMLSRMQELGTEDFWELSALPGALPRETQLYVPKILAVALVLRNLDRFGFDDVRPESAIAASELEVPPNTSLATLARAAGTSVETLRELNPELATNTVPRKSGASPVIVRVPASGLARARTMLPRLLDPLDRDALENRVGPSFDWGTDEVPRDGKAAKQAAKEAAERDAAKDAAHPNAHSAREHDKSDRSDKADPSEKSDKSVKPGRRETKKKG
jgi:membrane-bound lytic murein transglycosylase D